METWEYVKREVLEAAGGLSGLLAYLDREMVFWTFVVIGLMSSAFLILSFILGEIGDLFHGVGEWAGDLLHSDHDAGDFDHDGGDGHAAAGEVSGIPSFFSIRFALSFLSGFGLTGAIATYRQADVITSSLLGVLVGFGLSGLTYLFVWLLASQQASFSITDADLIGKEAVVIVEIPTQGLGQVLVSVGEISINKLAQSVSGRTLPEHRLVRIKSIVGQTVFVEED